MDPEGNIHRNVTEEEIKAANMTEITEEEANELDKSPKEMRAELLQQMRQRAHRLKLIADQRRVDRKRRRQFAKAQKKRLIKKHR